MAVEWKHGDCKSVVVRRRIRLSVRNVTELCATSRSSQAKISARMSIKDERKTRHRRRSTRKKDCCREDHTVGSSRSKSTTGDSREKLSWPLKMVLTDLERNRESGQESLIVKALP